jgi:molecular chaperone HscB
LDEKLDIDKNILRKLFYENSRKYHPDFFSLNTKEEQDDVLAKSTINNEAFRTLSDDALRLKHLLELKGVLIEGENEQLSEDFLMEMMEINEALMDAEFGELSSPRLEELNRTVENLLETINQDILKIGSTNPLSKSDLIRLKDNYYRKKYINRLKENIKKIELTCQ